MLAGLKAWIKPKLSPRFILATHRWRARFAAWYFHYPAKKLRIIGVTGTNGKTTTCILIGSILKSSGAVSAEATTVRFRIKDKVWKNNAKMTTISPWLLQKFLRQAQQAGCEYVVLEVTSHALEQFRVWGINFYATVLTNITHDHLDYHQTFKKYVSAKLKLFKNFPQVSAINLDDPSGGLFIKQKAKKKFTYAISSKKALIRATKIISRDDGELFTLVTPRGQISIQLHILGKFNIYNALAAASIGLGLGISLETIKRGLEQIKGVRGRLEKIDLGQPFYVILDYAHTPDALEKIYQVLRPKVKKRIIAVFGATGERDKTKRPKLGQIASRAADIIVLTNEDPYTEDPREIMKQVAQGIQGKKWVRGKNYFQILNRRKAIAQALRIAQPKDLVLITGKGHEEMMAVRHPHNRRVSILIPFNERQIVRQELQRLGYTSKN